MKAFVYLSAFTWKARSSTFPRKYWIRPLASIQVPMGNGNADMDSNRRDNDKNPRFELVSDLWRWSLLDKLVGSFNLRPLGKYTT